MPATLTGIKPRFLYDTSVFDGATVTTNSDTTDLPATNLQNAIVRRPWRTAGTTQMAWAVYDLGTATAVDMIAVFGHNLTSVALLTIQGNASDSWGSPSLNVGLTIPANADSVLFEKAVSFATGTYRYWRLAVQGANDGTYWEVGRLMAGQYFEPTVPQDLRAQRSIEDPSITDRADGMQTYSREVDQFYVYRINQTNLSQGDRDSWLAMFQNRGTRLPMAIAFDPTNDHRFNRDTIYGKIASPLKESLIQLEYGTLRMNFAEQW